MRGCVFGARAGRHGYIYGAFSNVTYSVQQREFWLVNMSITKHQPESWKWRGCANRWGLSGDTDAERMNDNSYSSLRGKAGRGSIAAFTTRDLLRLS